MLSEYVDKINTFNKTGEPYATAIVVRNEPPSSGKPGDKAIITTDGVIHGWIGGGCAQPVIIKEAKIALEEGKSRLVRITPNMDTNVENGIILYNMTCHSGGTLDIFIEPVLPQPQLVIIGRSVIAQKLAKVAKALDYTTTIMASGAHKDLFPQATSIIPNLDITQIKVTPSTYIIVSTQGENDEEALEQVLKTNCSYIAFIASQKKFKSISNFLIDSGVSQDQIDRIRVPAGIDINAKTPSEVAISILAEIIMVKRNIKMKDLDSADEKEIELIIEEAPKPSEAIDLICNMTVNIATAKYTSEHAGKMYYFCCAGCKQTFKKNPEKYISLTT